MSKSTEGISMDFSPQELEDLLVVTEFMCTRLTQVARRDEAAGCPAESVHMCAERYAALSARLHEEIKRIYF